MATVTPLQKTSILDPVDSDLESSFADGVVTPGPTPYLDPTPLYKRIRPHEKAVTKDWCRSVLASFIHTMNFNQVGLGTPTAPYYLDTTDGSTFTRLTIIGGLIVDAQVI